MPPLAKRGALSTGRGTKVQNSDISTTNLLNDELDFPRENRILIDWVSFTTRLHTVSDIKQLLGLTDVPFEDLPGSRGKKHRYYFGGISIHADDIQNNVLTGDYIWLEMSGQGCRSFETHGNGKYELLFDAAIAYPTEIHLTRLDVAFDDMTGVLDITQLCDETRLENYTSLLQKYQSIYSNAGNTVYFGSRLSKTLIRIYDKAMERGYDNKEVHWIRCELQLKDTNALGFAKKMKEIPITDVYRGVLRRYLQYRTPSDTDSNKARWEIQEWWNRFLDYSIPLSVWQKPGVIYNLHVCEKYVLSQPVGSIKTLIKIYGKEAFVSMIENAPPSKNPKYRRLISEYEENRKHHKVSSSVDKLITGIGDDEAWFLEDLRKCLNSLIYVANHVPSSLSATEYVDGKLQYKHKDINSILSSIRDLRELRIPSFQKLDVLESDEDLIDPTPNDADPYKAIHQSVEEKAEQRRKDHEAARAAAYLQAHGLNVSNK